MSVFTDLIEKIKTRQYAENEMMEIIAECFEAIPASESSSEPKWEFIEYLEIEDAQTNITKTYAKEYKGFKIAAWVSSGNSNSYITFDFYQGVQKVCGFGPISNIINTESDQLTMLFSILDKGHWENMYTTLVPTTAEFTNLLYKYDEEPITEADYSYVNSIKLESATLPIGTTFTIWGLI